jgi:Outer membrane protein beta-barrel domain
MKNIILIISCVCLGLFCNAQTKGTNEWHANWEFGMPVGNNFVTNFCALGFDVGYGKYIKDDLEVGLQIGWNNYYEYASRKTYEFAGGAATTDLYKYIYTLPITAFISHSFRVSETFIPFAKLGVGGQYSEQNLYYNIYETTNDNWGFVVAPEVGAVVHFSQGNPWGLYASVKYSYSTNSDTELKISNIQTLNFSVGIICVFH